MNFCRYILVVILLVGSAQSIESNPLSVSKFWPKVLLILGGSALAAVSTYVISKAVYNVIPPIAVSPYPEVLGKLNNFYYYALGYSNDNASTIPATSYNSLFHPPRPYVIKTAYFAGLGIFLVGVYLIAASLLDSKPPVSLPIFYSYLPPFYRSTRQNPEHKIIFVHYN